MPRGAARPRILPLLTAAEKEKKMPLIRLSRSAGLTTTETGVLLRSDLGTFQLEGRDVQRFLAALTPHLADWQEQDALVAALGDYSPASVLSLLLLLQENGLLESRQTLDDSAPEAERWRGQEGFFRKWTEDPAGAMRRLRQARVLMVGLEPWGIVAAAEMAASGLGALHLLDAGEVRPADLLSVRAWDRHHLGLPRADALRGVLAEQAPWCSVTSAPLLVDGASALQAPDADWDLILVALPGDDLRSLRAAARYAHASGRTSLYGHIEGLDAVLGPGVVPGQTACWDCCRLRLLANADQPETAHDLQAALLADSPAARERTYLAPMAATLGHLMALEAVKIVADYTPSGLIGRLSTLSLVTLKTEQHKVIRMPWCETCGGAAGGRPAGGPVLAPAPSGPSPPESLGDARSAEELRQKLAGWVDARTGIVRALRMDPPQTGDPDLPLAATAVLGSYTEGRRDLHEPLVGSGKGLSAVDALLGAVGEAVERYSASRFRVAETCRSRLADLDGPALDPRALCLYDDWQYEQPGFPFARFSADRPLPWTEAHWLDGGGPVWVPALPTFFNFPAPPEEYFCQVSSNGLAAGGSLDDAALRAVFELVERDAFMLSWMARRPGRRLMPDDTLDPGVGEVIRQLARRGARTELYLLDVGLGLPTVVAIAFGDGREWPGATVALATHASPGVALRKAVLELGHVSPYIRRLMVGGERPVPACPEEVRTLEDHALYYVPPERARAFDFLRDGSALLPLAELAGPATVSREECAARLAAGGVRVAIADVTSPDVATGPFRVARALGTDMQPIDFGHHLRRLNNPRLKAMLTGPVNPDPHPLA